MYAHHVEIPNPLYTSWARAGQDDYELFILMCALEAWHVISPLVKAGIVTIGLGRAKKFRSPDFISMAMKTTRGRRALCEMWPELGLTESNFVSSDDYARVFDEAQNYVYTPDEIANRMTDAYILDDVARSISRSHGDLWLPAPIYLEVLASARESMVRADQKVLTWLTGISVTDFANIDTKDMISIRMNSDVFDGWREALQATYKQLEIKAETGGLPDASVDAADFLKGQAEHLRASLRRDMRSLVPGAVRSLVVGLAAAVPNIAAAGSIQTSSYVGGITGIGAGVVWDFIGSTPRRRSSKAMVRHAMSLASEI